MTVSAARIVLIVAALAASSGTLAQETQQPIAPKELVAPDIPGVVKGGTKIVRISEGGFNGGEGAITMTDGSLLFAEQGAARILKVDKQDRFTTYLTHTNTSLSLAYDHKGRLLATQWDPPSIGVLAPTRGTLASSFEGQHLVHPNDLVVDRKGGVYFTDQTVSRGVPVPDTPPGRKPLLFYIRPDGTLTKLTEDIGDPNGIQLSPDEKTLYATNRTVIVAFDVQPDGSVRNSRTFAMSGGDGMTVDNAGRLYVVVPNMQAVRVFSPRGQELGQIPTGVTQFSAAFAGPQKKTFYIVGRGGVQKLQMIAEGVRSRAK